jgi:uncharacterized membrane protein
MTPTNPDPSMLTNLIDAPSTTEALDPIANSLNTASEAVVKFAPVRSLLRGEWMGSPMHPGIVWVPGGLSLGAVMLSATKKTQPEAKALLIASLWATPFAALTGLADASTLDKPGRRIAALHATLNTVGSGLQAMSLMRQKRGRVNRPMLITGFGISMAAAMWGRHLAYNYRAELVDPLGDPSGTSMPTL